MHAHQRPKLDTYDETLFIVLKPARYVDSEEIVALTEIMLFLGDGFLITVRHGESPVLGEVRQHAGGGPGRA